MSAAAPALKLELTITERDRARLVQYAVGILHNYEDAEDATQQAILNAWARGQFRGDSAPLTYLTKCVRNECLTVIRSRGGRLMLQFPQQVGLSYRPQIEASIDAHRKLNTCLRVLPPKWAEVARLLASGMNFLEIAKAVNEPHTTAKTRGFRMRIFLKHSKAVARR